MSVFCVSFILEAPMQWPHPSCWAGWQAFNTSESTATAIADSSSLPSSSSSSSWTVTSPLSSPGHPIRQSLSNDGRFQSKIVYLLYIRQKPWSLRKKFFFLNSLAVNSARRNVNLLGFDVMVQRNIQSIGDHRERVTGQSQVCQDVATIEETSDRGTSRRDEGRSKRCSDVEALSAQLCQSYGG